jgi:hypothetical protein
MATEANCIAQLLYMFGGMAADEHGLFPPLIHIDSILETFGPEAKQNNQWMGAVSDLKHSSGPGISVSLYLGCGLDRYRHLRPNR